MAPDPNAQSGFYVSERPYIPPGNDAKSVQQMQQGASTLGSTQIVKVKINQLRGDISRWHEQASTWSAIARKISGLPMNDSYTLIAPFTPGYNSAASKLASFSAAAPDQLEKTSTNVRDAADSYENIDHDEGQKLKDIELKDGSGEWTRFSPSGAFNMKPSTELDAKTKELASQSSTAPTTTKALENSIKFLQNASSTDHNFNPLNGEVSWKGGPGGKGGVSSEAGKMSIEAKRSFDLVQAVMSGTTSADGYDLAGKISGNIGVNAKGEFVLNAEGLTASLGAFAGAQATAEGSISNDFVLPGVTLKGTVGVTAGPGAKIDAKIGMGEDGKWHLGATPTISPLLGAKAGGEIVIDPKKFFGDNVVTEQIWTTTGAQIDTQGVTLSQLSCGPIYISIQAAANSKSAKKKCLEGTIQQAGNDVTKAFSNFTKTYKIVQDAKDFPAKSQTLIEGWDTVARDAGYSCNDMKKVHCTEYWQGFAAEMYDNLAARHANAAYDVSEAGSLICEVLEKISKAMNVLFGVALASGKIVEAKISETVKNCQTCAKADDAGEAAAKLVGQLHEAKGEVAKQTSTLVIAVEAFEQLAAKYGELTRSAGDAVGSLTGGGWPAA